MLSPTGIYGWGKGVPQTLAAVLAIVRKAFRAWDQAVAQDKWRMLANIVSNAGITRLCSDDVIRLFLDWIEIYNEVYFAVIREIFRNSGSRRFGIWSEIYGEIPRENSAEADLYKLLIRDLSAGELYDRHAKRSVCQKTPSKRRGKAPTVLESAFEDEKAYLLTSLGQQFVHYAMNESVTRLRGENRV